VSTWVQKREKGPAFLGNVMLYQAELCSLSGVENATDAPTAPTGSWFGPDMTVAGRTERNSGRSKEKGERKAANG
jgi:hypothetical protein